MCHAGYTAGEGEFNFEYFVGSESSDVSDGVDRGAKGGVFTECEKEEVQDYLRFLLASDYAEKKRKGLKVLYVALGSEYTL